MDAISDVNCKNVCFVNFRNIQESVLLLLDYISNNATQHVPLRNTFEQRDLHRHDFYKKIPLSADDSIDLILSISLARNFYHNYIRRTKHEKKEADSASCFSERD
ncbi:hypothetical protein CW304_00615 [Bacillus sp. UFRGS-B20]|nr:hypothetical protein CW304_00615 [Bacillus sp. UFRGS-B20]